MRRLQQDLLVVVERVMSESTYEQGKVGKKGMAGIFGDKLVSRWDGGGLVRVGSLVEKTTTLSWATRHLFASIVCLLFWDSIETNH